ncbi:hypothetical protein CQA53_07900 [Helicobacter didelphidarum]|uniref:Lipoprotein n=1 Tax=Helicobacter didelphidarum TaxID=2040648 RepID=A0A3D8IGD7_9HELI|nr:hypothetical protein [Helicobacter didelphidarum]RDU64055.1 hypothetical protein CQA53_07900 [Helicobacter didelphidarum]
MLVKIIQHGILSILLLCSCTNLLHAKINAKQHAENITQSLGEAKCQGNDSKATCTLNRMYNDDAITNIKFIVASEEKSISYVLSGDITPRNIGEENKYKDLFPKKFLCNTALNLNTPRLLNKYECALNTDTYTLKTNGNIQTQSKTFNGKDLETILKDIEKMVDWEFLFEQFVFEINAPKIGDKVFMLLKENDAELTKQLYSANINAFIAVLPTILLRNSEIKAQTTEGILKVASGIGEILTSNKQYAKIILKRKNATTMTLSELYAIVNDISMNPQVALRYLNDYDINITTR